MENTLIIKTGAAGDVVRTTSLLNVITGNIYWVTGNANKSLFPEGIQELNVLSLEESFLFFGKYYVFPCNIIRGRQ